MRAYIARVRKKVEPRFINITAGDVNAAWQPLLIWKNTQYATHRRKFDPRQLQVEGEPPFNQKDVVEPEWDNAFGPGKTHPGREISPAIRISLFRLVNARATKRRGAGFAACFPTCSTRRSAAGTISGRAKMKAAI